MNLVSKNDLESPLATATVQLGEEKVAQLGKLYSQKSGEYGNKHKNK